MFSIKVLSPMWWIATFGPSSSLLPVPMPFAVPFMVPAYPGWGGLFCLLTGLIPEQHALVSRHDASTVSSSTETGSLEQLPWLLDNEGQVEQSQVTQSPHSTMSQLPDTWVCLPMISRTSVTPDTWAINAYPVPWCVFNCYVTKVTDTLYIKTQIGFHQFISCLIITTDKWGQTWAQKMAQHKQKVIDRMKKWSFKNI